MGRAEKWAVVGFTVAEVLSGRVSLGGGAGRGEAIKAPTRRGVGG